MQSRASENNLPRRFQVFGSIRQKTLAILAITFLSSFLILYLISQDVLLQSFKELEIFSARHCLTQIDREIDQNLKMLETTNRDWAFWDDLYAFVAKPTQEFINTNLADDTFNNLLLDFMGFFDPDGNPVHLVAYDRQLGGKIPFSGDLLDYFKIHPELLRHADAESVRKGIVVFPQGPMLFVSRPILTSTLQGPVHGALVFGRALDAEEAKRIGQNVEVFLKISTLVEARENPQQSEIIRKIQASGEKIAVLDNGTQSLGGALLVDDIFGKPALLLEASLHRSIYARGQQAITVLGWFFLGISALICLVIMLLLDRLVIRPVVVLSDSVSRVGEDADAEGRVVSAGPEEIRRLAAAINSMLDRLAAVSQHLARKNAQLEHEITERQGLQNEREKLIGQLQEALAQVRTLSGFLPICASCKKIRDDSGYWKQIESYISAHADVTFSHGICPECALKLYGEYLDGEETLREK